MNPVLPAPAGGDQNRGPALLVVEGLFLAIAGAMVILRIYIRGRVKHVLWWDDFCIVLALLLSGVQLGLVAVAVHHGVGRHAYYLTLEQEIQIAKFVYLDQVFVTLSTMFVRVSVALFLFRLFTVTRSRKMAFFAFIAFLFIANLFFAFITLGTCRPLGKLWNPTISGTCFSPAEAPGYTQGVISSVCDLVLAALPSILLWSVHIKLKTKLVVGGLMGLGVFTAVCAIVRTVLEWEGNRDTYSLALLGIWGTLEQDVGILAATIPTLRPLFQTENRRWIRYILNLSGVSWVRASLHRSRGSGFTRTTSLTPDRADKSMKNSSNGEGDQVPLNDYVGIMRTTEISATTLDAPVDKQYGNREESSVSHFV